MSHERSRSTFKDKVQAGSVIVAGGSAVLHEGAIIIGNEDISRLVFLPIPPSLLIFFAICSIDYMRSRIREHGNTKG